MERNVWIKQNWDVPGLGGFLVDQPPNQPNDIWLLWFYKNN